MMLDIWREKIQQLNVIDTGALRDSLQELVTTGHVTTIEHKFLQYGIFVAAGVGPAHIWKYWGGNKPKGDTSNKPRERIGDTGQLEFLDKSYRQEHGLDEPKKVGPAWGGRVAGGTPKGKRDWFFRKYYYSIRRLNLEESAFYGRAYQGLMSSFLDELFSGGIRTNRF
ncbi:MAG: hypothetical protein IKM76_11610 [Prevotella sp.]|nr:hypothetical protein [Prevotella sp.]MBR6828775.1 hypothetical protein [Prevotella sp.]MBR6867141.1 hypothetical protein [Prevotella sp.]